MTTRLTRATEHATATGTASWWRQGLRLVKQVGVRSWKRIEKHEILTRSAAVAFYAFAALVPFLALVLTISAQLLPVLGGAEAGKPGVGALTVEQLRSTVADLVPPEAAKVIEDEIVRLQQRPAVPLLSVGLALTLWLSSSLFLAVIDALNRIMGVKETRALWRLRLAAATLAIVQSLVLVSALAMIVIWPRVPGWLGLDPPAAVVATMVQWLVVSGMIALSFAITLHFAPNTRRCWAWITPGSLFGTAGLLIASLVFRYYVENWGNYSVTYGSLGGVVVLLGWMWVCAFVLFTAAVINQVLAEIQDPCDGPGQPERPKPESP
jgi:membrane protein